MKSDNSFQPPNLKQLLIGVSVIVTCLAIPALFVLGSLTPHVAGELLATLAGFVTTPFFMEFSLAVLGLVVLLSVNHIRNRREGDDCVYLEEVTGKEAAEIPAHARWAVFAERPAEPEEQDLLAEVEGLIALGDYDDAAHLLSKLDAERLGTKPVLKLRIQLAEASGRPALAQRLRKNLQGQPSA